MLKFSRVKYPQIEREIDTVIEQVGSPKKSKVSKEKTMKGALLYSPKELSLRFTKAFRARDFTELRDTYTIEIPNSNVAIKGAFKQIDFVKQKVLVEVQFGKYAFMFYDMAKVQCFFNENKR